MSNSDERDLILAGLLKGCHEGTKSYDFDDTIINSEEGRKFILNIVEFFVNKVIEKTEDKMSRAPQREKDKAKRCYRNYEFIRDSINRTHTSTEDLYYVLIRKAAIYIDFIEDGIDHNNDFPLDILDMFELTSWFNSNIDRYRTEEIMVVLINKLFSSSYRDLFI